MRAIEGGRRQGKRSHEKREKAKKKRIVDDIEILIQKYKKHFHEVLPEKVEEFKIFAVNQIIVSFNECFKDSEMEKRYYKEYYIKQFYKAIGVDLEKRLDKNS